MEKSNFVNGIAKYWWLPLISGIIFIGIGVWCLCDPGQSLPILAYIFAGAIGAVGIFNVIFGCVNVSRYGGWGWTVGAGVVEILFSILLFFIPDSILTFIFVYGIGFYIIFMSIYDFFNNFAMVRYSWGWMCLFLLFLLGAVVFACIFILSPVATAVIGWLSIGISFICYGIFRAMLAFKINKVGELGE